MELEKDVIQYELADNGLATIWLNRPHKRNCVSPQLLRDLEAGGQVEADHIVGWMLELARNHRLDDTILSIAYTHLKAYENRRDAKRLP